MMGLLLHSAGLVGLITFGILGWANKDCFLCFLSGFSLVLMVLGGIMGRGGLTVTFVQKGGG